MATKMETPTTTQRSSSSSSDESSLPEGHYSSPGSTSTGSDSDDDDDRKVVYKDDYEGSSTSEVESDGDDLDDEFSPKHDGDDVDTWITNGKKKKPEKTKIKKVAADSASSVEPSTTVKIKKQKQKDDRSSNNDNVINLLSPSNSPSKSTTKAAKKNDGETSTKATARRASPRKHASTAAASSSGVTAHASASTTKTTSDPDMSSPSCAKASKTKSQKRKVSMSPSDSLAKIQPMKQQRQDNECDDFGTAGADSERTTADTISSNAKQDPPPQQNKIESKISKKQNSTKHGTKKKQTTTVDGKGKIVKAAPDPSTAQQDKDNSTAASQKETSTTKSSSSQNTQAPKGVSKQTATGTAVVSSAGNPAPSTEKHPKKKKKTFQDQLLSKMFLACKPFNMKELLQVMPPGTSEASINFCLISLVDKKWVIKKEFPGKAGRVKELYWANQDCQSKELKAILSDVMLPVDEIANTRRELAGMQQQSKVLQAELTDILQTPSNVDLQNQVSEAQQEVAKLESQLDAMKHRISMAANAAGRSSVRGAGGSAGKSSPVTLKRQINKLIDEWRRRKRICMDFIDNLSDAMEKSPKDVINKVLELETDERVFGASFAGIHPKHDLGTSNGSGGNGSRNAQRWTRKARTK